MKKLASFLALVALSAARSSVAAPASGPLNSGTEVTGRLSTAPHDTPTPAAAKPAEKSATEASLARDEKGKSAASAFTASDPVIYLVTRNVSGAKGDKVRAHWIADDTAGKYAKNHTVIDNSITLPDAKSYNPSFNLSAPKGGFYPGKYHVDLYVGATLAANLKFTIK